MENNQKKEKKGCNTLKVVVLTALGTGLVCLEIARKGKDLKNVWNWIKDTVSGMRKQNSATSSQPQPQNREQRNPNQNQNWSGKRRNN